MTSCVKKAAIITEEYQKILREAWAQLPIYAADDDDRANQLGTGTRKLSQYNPGVVGGKMGQGHHRINKLL
jgi:hypothetical protein